MAQPVMILADGTLGQMMEPVEFSAETKSEPVENLGPPRER